MKLDFLICSELASVDERSRVLSIFSIIEEINAASFPVVIPRLCINTMWTRVEEESSTPNLSLQVSVNGQIVVDGPFAMSFHGRLRTRTLGEVNGFVVPAPGELVVKIFEGDHLHGEWKIPAKQIGNPAPNLFSTPAAGSAPNQEAS